MNTILTCLAILVAGCLITAVSILLIRWLVPEHLRGSEERREPVFAFAGVLYALVASSTSDERVKWSLIAAVYFALALASDIDLDEVKTEIVRIAYENLRQADMNYGETVPLLSVTGSTVDSITARLKVYALRSYTQIQIDNVVMPPVLDYLKSIGGLAHCYSGK